MVTTTPRSFTLPAIMAITLLIASGCASRDGDDGNSGTCDSDGVCESGETAATCSADCDTTGCDSDGVCEAGEDHASCAADCAGDNDVFGPESAAWPCRGGKQGGVEYFECQASFMQASVAGDVPTWVGVCPSEGINGYWTGPKKPTGAPVNGWWRLTLQGSAADCELTVSQCSDRTNPHCWLQYGTSTITNDADAGPYRWCNGDCAMKLRRNPGHKPTPLGN